jgi:hypothetical protein
LQGYWKSLYLKDFFEEAIDFIVHKAQKRPKGVPTSSSYMRISSPWATRSIGWPLECRLQAAPSVCCDPAQLPWRHLGVRTGRPGFSESMALQIEFEAHTRA